MAQKSPGSPWQKAGELEFKEFRQGAAGKTANTDRDLGLIENANQKGEIYQLFKGDKPINLQDAENDLQRIYENAYLHAGGSDARLAMQHITTSGGLESYKDPVLVTKLNNPGNVARINKGWGSPERGGPPKQGDPRGNGHGRVCRAVQEDRRRESGG